MPTGIYIRTEQHCANISAAMTGVPKSAEHNASLSAAMTGVPKSAQHIANLSAAMTGRTRSAAHCDSISVVRKKYFKEHPEENPFYRDGSWINGIGPDYHANFTEEFRESIRDRDNRVCQICGKLEEQNNQALCVHHIHYDAETNDCSNSEDFISLCKSCHSVTTVGNREYWQQLLSKESK